MSTPAPNYKKAAAGVVYHSAAVGLAAEAILNGLEKTQIAARIKLKFDIKEKLAYLAFGECVHQVMV